MKHLLTLLFILIAYGVTAQKSSFRLNVQDFCELTVVDGINVEYTCNADSSGWATFECGQEIASKIMFTNNAQRLTIQSTADESPIAGMPLVKVCSSSLRRVENSGDSLLTVHANGHADKFSALQIGNGKLDIMNIDTTELTANVAAGNGSLSVGGKAMKAKFTNISAGNINAAGLDVAAARCYVFGKGNVYVTPKEQLKVYGAGSGKVYYVTAPPKIANRGIGVKAMPLKK